MVFPIVGGDGKPTGYDIDNSLRLGPSGGGTTPHVNLRRTLGSAGTEETFTYSCWIKISAKSEYNYWLLGGSQETSSPNQATYFRISSNDKLRLSDGSVNLIPNRLFRDPNAWYHLVLAVDSTQGTASNRVKIYVNGVQETSFATETYPDQNLAFRVLENGVTQSIGTWIADDGTAYACDDAYISEVYLIDGQQLDSSYFGEFNDDGVWIPKDYTGTYGTHGFRFEFKQTGSSANSSGIGADTSGNDNHFSVNNSATTDITTDTPTNNFATMNPIHKSESGTNNLPTFSEGNLKIAMNSDSSTSSTIAPASGKWYVEYKQSENTADNQGFPTVGISATLGGNPGDTIGFRTPSGTNYRGQLGTSSVDNVFLSAREANDVFGFYIDLDNSKLIVHKNGSNYMNTGYTGGLDWSGGLTTTNEQTGFYHFYVQNNSDGSPRYTDEVNFGNPTFSISSSNSDANGYGSFEYSPTLSGTDYYAMCTKNLAEYG